MTLLIPTAVLIALWMLISPPTSSVSERMVLRHAMITRRKWRLLDRY